MIKILILIKVYFPDPQSCRIHVRTVRKPHMAGWSSRRPWLPRSGLSMTRCDPIPHTPTSFSMVGHFLINNFVFMTSLNKKSDNIPVSWSYFHFFQRKFGFFFMYIENFFLLIWNVNFSGHDSAIGISSASYQRRSLILHPGSRCCAEWEGCVQHAD